METGEEGNGDAMREDERRRGKEEKRRRGAKEKCRRR